MSHNEEKSLVLQLRDAAKLEIDELKKFKMRDAADRIQIATEAFSAAQTTNNMRNLNGAWVSGIRALNLATPINGPTGPQTSFGREKVAA